MRETIQETYNVSELQEIKKGLQEKLATSSLTEAEIWEIKDLMNLINRRIRLMNDLLIGLQPRI